MAYRNHPSTFDPVIDAASTMNPNDDAEVKATVTSIDDMLTNRPREESLVVNGNSPDLAHLRIAGSHAKLTGLLERAIANKLPAPFTDALKRAVQEAGQALDVAVEGRSPDSASEDRQCARPGSQAGGSAGVDRGPARQRGTRD